MNSTFYTIIYCRQVHNCLKTSKNGFLEYGFIVDLNVILTRIIISSWQVKILQKKIKKFIRQFYPIQITLCPYILYYTDNVNNMLPRKMLCSSKFLLLHYLVDHFSNAINFTLYNVTSLQKNIKMKNNNSKLIDNFLQDINQNGR